MKQKDGFTIIELLTVISIVGILFAISVPNYQGWRSAYGLRSASADLYSYLQLARITAIKTQSPCAITFYEDGYIVYEDTGGSPLEPEPGENVLARVYLDQYYGVHYDTEKGSGDGITFFYNDDKDPSIAYLPNGLTRTNSGGFGAGSVYLKTSDGERKRRIVVSSVGNIRVE